MDFAPPVAIDALVEEPGAVRRLLEQHAPYAPVQRYLGSAAEFRNASGSAPDHRPELPRRLGVRGPGRAGRRTVPRARNAPGRGRASLPEPARPALRRVQQHHLAAPVPPIDR